MAISNEQLIQEIKDEVIGEGLDAKVDLWWGYYNGLYSAIAGLTYAYTRWKILSILLSRRRVAVDYQTGNDRVKAEQEFNHIKDLLSMAWDEVIRLDETLNISGVKAAVSKTMPRNMPETNTSWSELPNLPC